jgi:hypothetical protein
MGGSDRNPDRASSRSCALGLAVGQAAVLELVDPVSAVDELECGHDVLEREPLEGGGPLQAALVSVDDLVAGLVRDGVEEHEQAAAVPSVCVGLQHGQGEKVVEPDLLQWRA